MLFLLAEEGPHTEVRVQWARLNGVLRMNTVENAAAIPRPPTAKSQRNGDMNKAPEYYIIFTGFNLHEPALRDWLKTCCKPVCYIQSRFQGLSTSMNDPGYEIVLQYVVLPTIDHMILLVAIYCP